LSERIAAYVTSGYSDCEINLRPALLATFDHNLYSYA